MININPKQSMETIVKYLLYLDIITLITNFFIKSAYILITIIMINIFSLFVYRLIKKYEHLLDSLMDINIFARKINNFAGEING
jgi:hypothetical protein